MFLRAVTSGVLLLSLAGCASLEPSGEGKVPQVFAPDSFTHRVATSEVALYWNCTRAEPGVLRMQGAAQNLGSMQEIRSLEFDLVGIGPQDRVVSGVKGEARDTAIRTRGVSPFRLDVRTAGSETRFDLYYQYHYSEGEQNDVLLAGPPMVPPRLLAQANRFLARDVCSESQHRRR